MVMLFIRWRVEGGLGGGDIDTGWGGGTGARGHGIDTDGRVGGVLMALTRKMEGGVLRW